MSTLKLRNIGISAHIDAGKTTLSERILFYCGRIHKMRDVRGGDGGATMDSDEIERRRGITIQSAATQVQWKEHTINLIDTPGHVDFTIEVERSLRVLDGAVLVLCAVGGVQSQTLTVDMQMRRYEIPRIVFINKMDRVGADCHRVVQQLRNRLNLTPVLVQLPILEDGCFAGVIDLITMEKVHFTGEHGQRIERTPIDASHRQQAIDARQNMLEILGMIDEPVMESLLGNLEPNEEVIRNALRKGTLDRSIVPVLLGSAYKNLGVQELLDAVAFYLPSPQDRTVHAYKKGSLAPVTLTCAVESPLVAMAFKTVVEKFGQLTYVRIYQGQIQKGDNLENERNRKVTRVGRMVRLHADQREEIESATAGDIIGLVGLECQSGDTLAAVGQSIALERMMVAKPVMQLSIAPRNRDDATKLAKALERFRRDDPSFQVRSDPESNEILIAGMGRLHLDVYIERLETEYDCPCDVGPPRVAYRERPSRSIEFSHRWKKQSGGPGQFAEIAARMELLPEGSESSFEFEDAVVGGRISKQFVPAVRQGFLDALKQGPLGGFEVVGVKLTLLDGSEHEKDSSEFAFRQCAHEAIREQVLPKAGVQLWEPVMRLEVEFPSEYQGPVVGDLGRKRGIVIDSEALGETCRVIAEAPLAELFNYANDLRSLTRGSGNFTLQPHTYRQTPAKVQEEILAHRTKPRGMAG